MSERLRNQGRLAELQKEGFELSIRLSSLRESIRNNLDPFEDLRNLKGDIVASDGMEFAEKQIQYIEVLKKISAVKKALGQ